MSLTAETPGARIRALDVNPRVLVADNNRVSQALAGRLLRQAGLVAWLASDGREAVEQARGGRFALILMDLHMPHLDGLAAARAIRTLPGCASVPIVAVTSEAGEDSLSRCLQAGMNDLLAKPYCARGFQAMLRRWMPAPGADAPSAALPAPPLTSP